MVEAGLRLCNRVTRENGLRLIPSVARTQLISKLFMFRIIHEWNLLPLEVTASPYHCFYLRKNYKNLA